MVIFTTSVTTPPREGNSVQTFGAMSHQALLQHSLVLYKLFPLFTTTTTTTTTTTNFIENWIITNTLFSHPQIAYELIEGGGGGAEDILQLKGLPIDGLVLLCSTACKWTTQYKCVL